MLYQIIADSLWADAFHGLDPLLQKPLKWLFTQLSYKTSVFSPKGISAHKRSSKLFQKGTRKHASITGEFTLFYKIIV